MPSTRQPVKKGTELLTTGRGTYAPGVTNGRVLSVTPDTTAISRTATVQPFVDVSSLDVIGVITQADRTAPSRPLVPVAPGPSPTSSPCGPATPVGAVTPTPTPSSTPVRPTAPVTPTVTSSP